MVCYAAKANRYRREYNGSVCQVPASPVAVHGGDSREEAQTCWKTMFQTTGRLRDSPTSQAEQDRWPGSRGETGSVRRVLTALGLAAIIWAPE